MGKGANYYFYASSLLRNTWARGDFCTSAHTDNCTGQNNNRYMMYYLMWRVLTGLHEEVKISLLPVGHTKFAPDWCFGFMKQRSRRTKIVDLDDIANCVTLSSSVNVPQLVGSTFVSTYNWSEHFEQHTIKIALKGTTQMHHFDSLQAHLVQYLLSQQGQQQKEKSTCSRMIPGHHLLTSFLLS